MSEQITAYKCLHCGHIQLGQFEICPACGKGPDIFSKSEDTKAYIHEAVGHLKPIIGL